MKKITVFVVSLLFFVLIGPVFAQLSNVANNIEIADPDAVPGDVLSVYEDGIRRSETDYDQKLYGVLVEFPVLSLGVKGDGTVSVLTSGQALVNVTAANGEIKAGDFVTTSATPGIAQKATNPGYALGKALAGYSDTATNGQIPVAVDIGFYSQSPNVGGVLASLLGNLSIGFSDAKNFPLVLRYLAAAVVAVVTFLVAGFSFIRFMRNGLEAIGRNPLARRTIISGMVLNAIIVGLLTIAGFGIAIAIVAF